MERAQKLSQKGWNSETRAYILYFLGCFYYKCKDLIQAKEKLKECVKLKSTIKTSASELLENIWNYQLRPSLWRFWFTSPLHGWPKRIGFILILLSISALFVFHPFIPSNLILVLGGLIFVSNGLKVDLNLYTFLIALLIFILIFPIMRRIKARDIEIEIRTPPPFDILSLATMAKLIGKLEK